MKYHLNMSDIYISVESHGFDIIGAGAPSGIIRVGWNGSVTVNILYKINGMIGLNFRCIFSSFFAQVPQWKFQFNCISLSLAD